MRDILYIDFEGTGTNPHTDRIVEACFHHVDEGPWTWSFRVNPGMAIPAEAAAIHGITDEHVRGLPRFSAYAARVQRLIEGKTLCGYNIRRYDTLLLDAELRRCGQPGLPRDAEGRLAVRELDLFALWQREEPRNLATAALRFGGEDLENAHTAEADTLALPRILGGMVEEFILDALDLDELCARCVPDGAVDRDGKFLRREDGVVVYAFSDKRGTPVADEPSLAEWMLKRDFSEETKAVARGLLREIREAERRRYAPTSAAPELPF